MSSFTNTDLDALRRSMVDMPAGAAWPAGQIPILHQVFTPQRHRNALDLSRSVVVGNRGVGKTFWSHALTSKSARQLASSAYGIKALDDVEAVFGFRGAVSESVTPSRTVLDDILKVGVDPLDVWQAVLLRIMGGATMSGLPLDDLGSLVSWFSNNREEGERRIRAGDKLRADRGRVLLVLFDALDTLAEDWAEIRSRTEGLLKLALLSKGLRGTRVKVFMRPDQYADTELFRFPDASKLRAERVELEWSSRDLYGLFFFSLWGNQQSRLALNRITPRGVSLFHEQKGSIRPDRVFLEPLQRELFTKLAGEWMGSNKKRGATYTWLVQHLADARGETTPRGFLTTLRSAAQHEDAADTTPIDYRGILSGVLEASENRVDDLRQDYWWIDFVRGSLVGLETPLLKEALFETWLQAGTCADIRRASKNRGPLPVFFSLRSNRDDLPRELALALESDEAALLQTLQLIGVAEIRPNGKVNIPDIFRVAFSMKRRGGIPPKRGKEG